MLDGENQQLRHGALVVDAQHGSGLDLQVAGLDVSAPAGTALRAERSVTVGRRTRRVVARGQQHRSLPAAGTVAAGRRRRRRAAGYVDDRYNPADDDGEAHAVPALVHDDEALVGLARGIDGTGAATATVVTAAWHVPLTRTPSGVGRSERVLPVVIATAGPASEANRRYRSAVALRTEGE